MARFTMTLEGEQSLTASVRAWEVQRRAAIGALIARTALAVERDAKKRAPVDTGFLRSKIRPDVTRVLTDLAAEVIAGADYSYYVETGTSRTRAQPFLVPAFEAAVPQFLRELRALLDR